VSLTAFVGLAVTYFLMTYSPVTCSPADPLYVDISPPNSIIHEEFSSFIASHLYHSWLYKYVLICSVISFIEL
jgi:hypothetical protein